MTSDLGGRAGRPDGSGGARLSTSLRRLHQRVSLAVSRRLDREPLRFEHHLERVRLRRRLRTCRTQPSCLRAQSGASRTVSDRAFPVTISCMRVGRRDRVDQSGRDRNVLDPQLLEVQGRGACPCTPTLATRPPGADRSVQSSNVSATPTASIATSAPRPPVSSFTAATGSTRARCRSSRLRRTRAPRREGRTRIDVDRDDAAGREQLARS